MYLKKLELIGFKSFPEKTPFVFNKGLTCIVGPNGCGKTNLLDALRWVLGEQKTSLLRGNKMEEVIFAGTRTLKPLGMAEVSLHIENADRMLPSQYGEISITRRLFRSGDSEYLMNKIPCRLKDITELFADTGLGSHAYAIIQQEMIDAILSDRAEERRFLFEEAAGITKYKQRKKAAERKLEATEHDLLRLQDILAEVTTRVNSLKRQVNKAQRYKEVADELKQWELFEAKNKFNRLMQQQKELAQTLQSMDDRRAELDTRLNQVFADLESGRTSLTEMEKNLSDISSQVYELSEQAHQVETEISVNREKKENLIQSAAHDKEEIIALDGRANAISDDRLRRTEELKEYDEKITASASELEEALRRLKAADERYLEYRSLTDDESARLLDLEGRISSGKTDSANIEEQTRDIQNEIEENTLRKDQIQQEKKHRRERMESLQNRINSIHNGIQDLTSRHTVRENELEETQQRGERLRDRQAELTSSYEATLARKNLLDEMVEQHEGFGSGVVAIFDVAGRWVDITGTVADFVRPHEGCQAAIEAALGEAAQYILCQNQTTAKEAVKYLQEIKAGRATFLIVEKLPETITRPDIQDTNGVIGWGDQLVDCDDRYRRIPLTLLGRTLLCEDLATAERMLEILPYGYQVVTRDGQYYNGAGQVSGGASDELSLIGRQDEIASLAEKLASIDGELARVKQNQAANTLKIGELRQALNNSRDELEEKKETLTEINSHLKEEQFKINASDEVLTSIEQRLDQMSQKLEKLKHRQYSLSLDYSELDRQKSDLSGQVQTRKERMTELEEAAQKASEEVNRLQVTKVEHESKRSQIESQINYYDEMLSDIAATTEQKKTQISEAEATVENLLVSIRQSEIRLKEVFDQRQEKQQQQRDLRAEHEEKSTAVNELESRSKTMRREKESLAEESHRSEITMTEIKSRLEQLEERIRKEHDSDIRTLTAEKPNAEMSDDQTGEHIETLRDKLRKMGIVNLLALEEYEQERERKEFLGRQLDDLIQAKNTLKNTILKINQTAKTMFMDTLDKARANFKDMFEELFTGGEADILLVDPTNPLESPLEIISRPRGKKPLTIAQLSGGERALTAISLLFALYMVKPSPFCFLDEIDAPLDDVNVARFLRIVEKFSRQTQFIIITHNKITMEAAATLYGVTMEEPGVSKVVAVRFNKEGEEESILDMHYARDERFKQQAG